MKTNLAQAKVTQTIHPFATIQTKSERKESIKEKNKLHTQKKKLKNNDLD
jgi:hypothetical protein